MGRGGGGIWSTRRPQTAFALGAALLSGACSAAPLEVYSGDAAPVVLVNLEDAGVRVAPSGEGAAPGRYRIAFVPGFSAQCFEGFSRPFGDAQQALEAEGFAVDYFGVAGRGTSAANAEQLAEHFEAVAEGSPPFIVFAYSKGLPDTLEFVLRHPEAASRIAAVVSVAGVANGSPLADELGEFYRDRAAGIPLPR